MIAAELGVSTQAARVALEKLSERDVLEPLTLQPSRPGRPPNLWYAPALLEEISRWSG